MSGQYKEGNNCPCCSKGQERSSHSKKRSRGNDSDLDSSDELLTIKDSYSRNRNQPRASNGVNLQSEYMDPIDKTFPLKDVKDLQLYKMGSRPKIRIDEDGFVDLAKELFKSIQYRVKDTLVHCSELEFVYYSLAVLRAQQFKRYGVDNLPYSSAQILEYGKWMDGRHYPAIFDPYFDCLGWTSSEFYMPYAMTMNRDDDPQRMPLVPHLSLSNLNRLLLVRDDDIMYQDMRDSLYSYETGISVTYPSEHRDDKGRIPTVYRTYDKYMPEPFKYVNLKAIRNVESFILSIGDKIRLSTIPEGLGISPCLYPEVALIRVDNSNKGKLSSRFHIQGKPLMLAAIFQLYTPAVVEEMPASLSSDGGFSISTLGPCDRLIEKYVDSAFI